MITWIGGINEYLIDGKVARLIKLLHFHIILPCGLKIKAASTTTRGKRAYLPRQAVTWELGRGGGWPGAQVRGHGQGRGHGCARWWTSAGDGRARGTGMRGQPPALGKHWLGGGECAFRPSGPPPAGGGRRTEHGGAGGRGLEQSWMTGLSLLGWNRFKFWAAA